MSDESHAHRSGPRHLLTGIGLTESAQKLNQIVEIAGHPWFVAVQFHPEFKSKPTAPHPLFDGFVIAAMSTNFNSTVGSATGPQQES